MTVANDSVAGTVTFKYMLTGAESFLWWKLVYTIHPQRR